MLCLEHTILQHILHNAFLAYAPSWKNALMWWSNMPALFTVVFILIHLCVEHAEAQGTLHSKDYGYTLDSNTFERN